MSINIYELFVLAMQEHMILFFVCSCISYALGGVDEYVGTLFLLQVLHSICLILARKRVPVSNMIKVYLVIATGVASNKVLNLETEDIRTYLLLYYSYNEVIDIVNILKEDGVLLPTKVLGKITKKGGKE